MDLCQISFPSAVKPMKKNKNISVLRIDSTKHICKTENYYNRGWKYIEYNLLWRKDYWTYSKVVLLKNNLLSSWQLHDAGLQPVSVTSV